jgi:hypothetical protein
MNEALLNKFEKYELSTSTLLQENKQIKAMTAQVPEWTRVFYVET